MRRRTQNSNDAIGGQDSFLDIVANLVGILIILVVIVSAQAKSASTNVPVAEDLASEYLQKQTELKQVRSLVSKMTTDNHQLENDIAEEKRLTKALADERHGKLMVLEQVRQNIESETANWQSHQKKKFDAQVVVSELKQQLTSVQQELAARQNHVNEVLKVETIEHFPTPIAKTVFTEEAHFRLSGGRISYVPMDELIDEMKSQWQVVSEELERTNQTVSTVGPIHNYRLQYKLMKQQVQSDGPTGTVTREAIKFDHFVILPTDPKLGELATEHLFSGSQFMDLLSDRPPEKTTISIWVYPDSFAEFMALKKHLHGRGYQVASWPLEFNRPISGGPNGFKTSAQ